jgi:hypothetical protein
MTMRNRKTLKVFFKKEKMPSEASFADLIDSMVNKLDDGFAKEVGNGLMLAPEEGSKSLLSFYKSIEDKSPVWSMQLTETATGKGLLIGEADQPSLYLQSGGNIGIGTLSPSSTLEVNGFVGMEGRMGTFFKGEAPANGEWTTIAPRLNGCQALEVVAGVGKRGDGKYALLHALALSTYGRSRNRIKKVQAHYGWFWNKMCLRWVSNSTFEYELQIRTRSNYGDSVKIKYHIARLWSDEAMGMPVQSQTEK